jgi:hypothetical protein
LDPRTSDGIRMTSRCCCASFCAYPIVLSASTPSRDFDLIYAMHYEMPAAATDYLMGPLGSVDTVKLAPHDAQRLPIRLKALTNQRV